MAVQPPSAVTLEPVINGHKSEMRNTTKLAISCAVPHRFKHRFSIRLLVNSSIDKFLEATSRVIANVSIAVKFQTESHRLRKKINRATYQCNQEK
jgi:hypothetical protein